ncbi:hypothetical protein TNCT_291531 [Trichonephila clavata]|uniref:TAZ-type domain-containing protein n=1 Tax=Trichonephila clavata TaxID=2740835 RepID=A0A8X6M4J3_TRICU|nr:hypothetical protein TNCT_291531 [Trichonephila clavata]
MSVLPDDVGRDSILPGGFGIKIRDSLAHLQHASICNNTDCENSTCAVIKKYFNHFTNCLDLVSCEDCDYFFDLASRHASICEIERCSTFLCENMIQNQSCMFPGTEESVEEENTANSNTDPVFPEGRQKYINLNEKLFSYIKNKKVTFSKRQLEPSEEALPPSEFVVQQNAPSTSEEVIQDQGDTRRRSKRLMKKP